MINNNYHDHYNLLQKCYCSLCCWTRTIINILPNNKYVIQPLIVGL